MSKKIGRNELCWCGSGKKYKHCHLNREAQPRIAPWKAEQEMRRVFSKKKCSVPDSWRSDCSSGIVRAHTVPKSISLKSIARDGHVYGYKLTFAKLTKHRGKIPPELIGINKASTFTGFCKKHDSNLFSPLETKKFEPTFEQCFLLAYRALAREIYTKDANADLSDVRRDSDRGRPENEQFAIQAYSTLFDIGVAAGQRDNLRHLDEMHKCISTNDFSSVRAYVIELSHPPPVMCSGGIFPEQTFNGKKLHDLSDPQDKAHLLTITSFFDGDRGYVVLVWLAGSDGRCIPFIESLRSLQCEGLTSALLRMIFEYLENTYISPHWWEGLSEIQRQALNGRMWGIVDQLMSGKLTGDIQDDGIDFEAWDIVRRFELGGHTTNGHVL